MGGFSAELHLAESVCKSRQQQLLIKANNYNYFEIISHYVNSVVIVGAVTAQWLERRIRDRKITGSSPHRRSGGRTHFQAFNRVSSRLC